MPGKALGHEIPTSQADQENQCFLYLREGMVLDNVEKIKYLCVTITNDLKLITHVSNMVVQFRIPKVYYTQDELEKMQKRAAKFVVGNNTY